MMTSPEGISVRAERSVGSAKRCSYL